MTAVETSFASHATQHCQDVTRREAKNFYYGLKLLPEPRRTAMYVIYAWMRKADDLVDGNSEAGSAAIDQIEDFRQETINALSGRPGHDDPVLHGLGEVAGQYTLPEQAFHDMLDGQQADLSDHVYQTFADLREYCRCVASSVGKVCLAIWGTTNHQAYPLAEDLGIAFQLTNILRDFQEDYSLGRIYLPSDDFDRFQLTPDELLDGEVSTRAQEFLHHQIQRVESYYASAEPLESMIDNECRPTLWAMRNIYHRLLLKMKRDPATIIRGPRVQLSALEKGAIALQAKWATRNKKQS